ncbi:MAG: transcription initiation factor IIB, partial [Candidatus Bathyarchaeota archaeon]|nr:transcription initiation factor IIB [Candidatus Bathyarchaeota archaeon]
IIRDARRKHGTIGKDPTGLAAAALYIASRIKKQKITQSRLAEVADITEVTIRNRTKDLMKNLNLSFN